MRRLCVVSLILVLLATASTAYAVPREPESGLAWHDCRTGPVDRRADGVYDARVPEMVAEVNRYLTPKRAK
jgi:hypothetical protein